MDKTGTLTKGTPEVTDIKTVSQHSKNEILQLLSSLESHSEHPLALAMVTKAKEKNYIFIK